MAGLEVRVRAALFCLVVALSKTSITASSQKAVVMSAGRTQERPWESEPLLPKHIVPLHYNLYLHPDIDGGTFSGDVKITLDVKEPSEYIVLHTYELNITDSKILLKNGGGIGVKDAFEYKPNQFWVVIPEEPLPVGLYYLKLKFSGSLTGKIIGLYRSSYKFEGSTASRHIVTTKFEPTYARRAFPCFDEPSFKATFQIFMVRPTRNYFVLSNMDQVRSLVNTPDLGLTTVEFNSTPPMSTYLVCFIVCDFASLGPIPTEDGIPIRVFARSGLELNMKYALDLTVAAMNYYSKYFGVKYPLPKLDLIAVPDFVSGAMENWGLITFREKNVLHAEGASSFTDLQQVSETVVHELAHMWFGDIVTMAWWDDLWLNEGFATYMSMKVLQELKPELEPEQSFILQQLQSVLVEDAALSSHPIIQNVSNPDQITEMFDSISYSKGASVLRMMEKFIPKGFRLGVTDYLQKFKFGNAMTEDLWEAISAHSKSVPHLKRMFRTWTKQMGYPIVHVKSAESDKIVLTQERGLLDKETQFDPSSSPFHYKWDIPITYVSSDEPNSTQNAVFSLENDEMVIPLKQNVSWMKLNSRQAGYYRVNYTHSQWENFIKILNECPEALQWPEDRGNLIDDSFSLAKAGYISYSIPLSLVGYLKHNKETSYMPWLITSRHFLKLNRALQNVNAVSDQLKKYFQTIVEPTLDEDTWNVTSETPFLESRLKVTKLTLACRVGVPSVLAKAHQMFNNWIEGRTDKPTSELRSLVYKYGLVDEKNWEKLWELYLVESDPQERSRFREALASIKNVSLLEKLIELSKNEDYVRSQDYFIILSLISLNPVGNKLVWNFTLNNWDYLVARFTLNHRGLGLLIPCITTSYNTRASLEEMKAFFSKYPEAGAGQRGRKRALETVEKNIEWREKYLPNITLWLDQHS